MNALTIPDLIPQGVLLLVAPHAAPGAMLELAAALARRGAVRVLDGGNQFNAYRVARSLRRHPGDLQAALARIQLSRAFTCYQIAGLLQQSPAAAVPTLVLDLLATFYDENVPREERRRLLAGCVGHLRRLSRRAPVAVAAAPAAPAQVERAMLLDLLRAGADRIWELEEPPAPPAPLGLFTGGA